jgi:hypothetical protein
MLVQQKKELIAVLMADLKKFSLRKLHQHLFDSGIKYSYQQFLYWLKTDDNAYTTLLEQSYFKPQGKDGKNATL